MRINYSVTILLLFFSWQLKAQTSYVNLMNGSSSAGLNDVILNNASCSVFDGYGGPIPNSPTYNWFVAALTIGNSGRGLQIAHGYPYHNELYFRGGTDGWQPWYRILNETNYGAFALPLTGGTLKGDLILQNPTSGYPILWLKDVSGNKRIRIDYNSLIAEGDNLILQSNGGNIFMNNATVGIGTTNVNSDYKLFVDKGIRTRKVKVDQTGWPDYVFHSAYKLPSLQEVEKFINKNKHLPGVASAKEVEEKGLDIGENQAALLKKIEELTLYVIEQNNRIKALEEKITKSATNNINKP